MSKVQRCQTKKHVPLDIWGPEHALMLLKNTTTVHMQNQPSSNVPPLLGFQISLSYSLMRPTTNTNHKPISLIFFFLEADTAANTAMLNPR